MAIGVAEKGNVYDLRGLAADRTTVDTSKIGVGTTYFEVDGQNDVYVWTGATWKKI